MLMKKTLITMSGKGLSFPFDPTLLCPLISHIFFDDCMERSSEEKGEWIVNKFVRDLIKSVDEFGRKW